MSDWHDELELALLPLKDLRVDSVYMTFVISNAPVSYTHLTLPTIYSV